MADNTRIQQLRTHWRQRAMQMGWAENAQDRADQRGLTKWSCTHQFAPRQELCGSKATWTNSAETRAGLHQYRDDEFEGRCEFHMVMDAQDREAKDAFPTRMAGMRHLATLRLHNPEKEVTVSTSDDKVAVRTGNISFEFTPEQVAALTAAIHQVGASMSGATPALKSLAATFAGPQKTPAQNPSATPRLQSHKK